MTDKQAKFQKENIPPNFYRISIKGLVLNNKNEFLLCREDNGHWELPGGGLDSGESPADCLKREIKEEMGLEVIQIVETPSYFVTSVHNLSGRDIVNVIYKIELKDLDFTPSDECQELKFFSVDTFEKEIKDKTFPNVLAFVEELKKS